MLWSRRLLPQNARKVCGHPSVTALQDQAVADRPFVDHDSRLYRDVLRLRAGWGCRSEICISGTLLTLNAYTKNYDLGELAQKHRRAAADLWLIREKYLALLTDLRAGEESLVKITNRRDVLLDELHGVYSGAPSTTSQAYKKAQEALQQYEEMTFSDSEIDVLLPRVLRKSVDTVEESN